MSYQVLARKSRPQDFDALIGQEPIVQALSNGLSEGRIAQAYLFSGIRGVGKTSAARVLAKALNCESGPTPSPCNHCQICIEITRGADLDVIEVDAATYSKVEQVRELTESLRYGPARDRYKVVILDEVHRLSRQAFDALLKIIEEPPAHLVFIFATTEIEAVPATILSRCQEFRFRRVPSPALAAHLRRLCESEEIEASDAALRLIARAGEGSVRDSVALLDQLATFGSGRIDDDEAARLLGGFDAGLFLGLLRAILEGDGAGVVATVRRLDEDGRDPRHVFAQFLSYCRDALHLALGSSPEHVDLPEEDRRDLEGLCRQSRYEDLLRLLHLLLASEASVRRSEAGALALELAWLRAAELPKLTRVETALAGLPASQRTSPATAPRSTRPPDPPAAPTPPRRPPVAASTPTPAPTPAPLAPAGEPSEKPSAGPTAESLAEASPAAEGAPELFPAGSEDAVESLLEAVGRRKQPLLVRLRTAIKIEFRSGELVLHGEAGDSSLKRALERDTNRKALAAALEEVCGEPLPWRFEVTKPLRAEASKPPPVAASSTEDRSRAEEDPRVQRVLDIFGGSVEDVLQHGRKGE